MTEKSFCPECYSEYSRVTPFYASENCLKNHRQYKCKTCGRLICIDKRGEHSFFAKFNSENAARYLLRGAEAFFKEECAIFKKHGNESYYFEILPVYGNLTKKNPAYFLPGTYCQPVKKQTGIISEEEVQKYIAEQKEERTKCDYKSLLSDDIQRLDLNFDFLSCKCGAIKLLFKTKYEVFSWDFFDDENDEAETSEFVLLAKWLLRISSENVNLSDVFKLYSNDAGSMCIKAEDGFLRFYDSFEPDDERLRLSCFSPYKSVFENFKTALKTFLENVYEPEEWERLSSNPDSDAYYDGYEGASLKKIYDCFEELEK